MEVRNTSHRRCKNPAEAIVKPVRDIRAKDEDRKVEKDAIEQERREREAERHAWKRDYGLAEGPVESLRYKIAGDLGYPGLCDSSKVPLSVAPNYLEAFVLGLEKIYFDRFQNQKEREPLPAECAAIRNGGVWPIAIAE